MQEPFFRVDEEYVEQSLVPRKTGVNNLIFRLEDKFSEISQAQLPLFVFGNLLPIASFEAIPGEANEYTFDAGASFDEDHNYGGRVVAYEWDIDGTPALPLPDPLSSISLPDRAPPSGSG